MSQPQPQQQLLVFGDSVPWGQGLLPGHKYAALVRDKLAASGRPLILDIIAHSGATIGIAGPSNGEQDGGEVPAATPTILEQVRTYKGDPDAASLILLDGGINDVDVRFILNPLTSLEQLRQKTQMYCLDSMTSLLKTISSTFKNPRTQIVVTDYFPILSDDSEPLRAPFLLAVHGVSMAPFAYHDLAFQKIIALCTQFWTDSSSFLEQAVRAQPDRRVIFVRTGFGPANAVFASTPWLWGINADLSPQDEVIAPRHAACDLKYPDDFDIFDREACYRASAGHPNVTGAQQFARSILTAITG